MPSVPPHVVIVGGGFAGLTAARRLGRAPVRVTLVDRRNHHLFQPLLYQVATGGLDPSDIAYPIRSVLRRQDNVTVLLAEVGGIEPGERRVRLEEGHLDYDHLILAAGSGVSYFGNEDWRRHAPGLKSVEDAVEIRRRLFLAYEAAEREPDPDVQREWLTFAIVGGGPTGVELAGAVSEIGRHTVAKDFRRFDPRSLRVILLEGDDQVLPSYPRHLAEKAEEQLRSLGVEVHTGRMVSSIDAAGLDVGEERIPARTVLWAAGVASSPLAGTLGVELDDGGRVPVERDLSVPGHPEIQVVGDLAAVPWQEGGTVPGLAQAAIQMGRHAAANVRRVVAGEERRPFDYVDKGTLATIGRAAAVAKIRRLEMAGFWAWVLWWAVHIAFLIGFRNRLVVMFEWMWSYVTYQRGARLITEPYPKDPRRRDEVLDDRNRPGY